MLAFTNLSGASLHGYLDGSTKALAETIQEGTGTATRTVPNPEYLRWWMQDQKVLGLLVSSMAEGIAMQLINCKTAAAAWAAIHAMYSTQNTAGIRHTRRQI